jgi:hypothetical protein
MTVRMQVTSESRGTNMRLACRTVLGCPLPLPTNVQPLRDCKLLACSRACIQGPVLRICKNHGSSCLQSRPSCMLPTIPEQTRKAS